MTDKTDIAALRKAVLKATPGEWCIDSSHSVIADAGLNANYYVAACSGPDCMANAIYIALANPATIIALLDQLEAERQRAEALKDKIADLHHIFGVEMTELEARAEAAVKELISINEAQGVPVAYLYSASFERGEVEGQVTDAPGCDMPVFAAPQLPVVPEGWQMVPIEPTEHMFVCGFESEPDEFFSPSDVWKAYEDMSGCGQAAHRAKLCWAAMLSAAPKPGGE